MSSINSYLKVLQEKNGSGVVGGNIKPGADIIEGGDKQGHGGPCECDGIEEPKKGLSVSDKDGEPKAAKEYKESTVDLFTSVYNKIIKEEENWESLADKEDESKEGEELSFTGDSDSGEGEIDLSGEEGDESGEATPEGMEEVLDALKAAVSALSKVLGKDEEDLEDLEEEDEMGEGGSEGEGGEGGEGGDLGGGDESNSLGDMSAPESSDGIKAEEVDAEILGHSLIDLDKLAASLTSPKSQVVKGAVPVTKGKAQTTKGAKVDGKPSELSGDPEELEDKKKQDVGGVTQGKTIFEQ